MDFWLGALCRLSYSVMGCWNLYVWIVVWGLLVLRVLLYALRFFVFVG